MPPTRPDGNDGHCDSVESKRDRVPVHLRALDVEHKGVQYFITHFASKAHALTTQYQVAHDILYDEVARKAWPPSHKGDAAAALALADKPWRQNEPRSITIILRSMDGVAFTTGTMLDNAHKEIHVSAEYIWKQVERYKGESSAHCNDDPTRPTATSTQPAPTATSVPGSTFLSRFRQAPSSPPPLKAANALPAPRDPIEAEIKGVLVHEAVHTIQFTGKETCPGGLVEGVADWVRLKAGLAPPHWRPPNKSDRKRHWDAGYDLTAYFLAWLETKLSYPHLVPHLNQALAHTTWNEGEALNSVVGRTVNLKALWKEFCSATQQDEKGGEAEKDDSESTEDEGGKA